MRKKGITFYDETGTPIAHVILEDSATELAAHHFYHLTLAFNPFENGESEFEIEQIS